MTNSVKSKNSLSPHDWKFVFPDFFWIPLHTSVIHKCTVFFHKWNPTLRNILQSLYNFWSDGKSTKLFCQIFALNKSKDISSVVYVPWNRFYERQQHSVLILFSVSSEMSLKRSHLSFQRTCQMLCKKADIWLTASWGCQAPLRSFSLSQKVQGHPFWSSWLL